MFLPWFWAKEAERLTDEEIEKIARRVTELVLTELLDGLKARDKRA